MKTSVLENIVNTINTNCKNFAAYLPLEPNEYWDIREGKLLKTESRTLRIQKRGNEKNQKFWNIFEKDMDKVIFKASQRNKDFADRVKNNTLSVYDVECIIRRSSFKILNLKMSYTPLFPVLE